MVSNVTLNGLAKDLAEREASGKPIRIGLVGTGEMGTDIFTGIAQMDGISIGSVCERTAGKAAIAANIAYGEDGHTQAVSNHDHMSAAIEMGKIAVTQDMDLALSHGLIDVVIDATGIPEAGADI